MNGEVVLRPARFRAMAFGAIAAVLWPILALLAAATVLVVTLDLLAGLACALALILVGWSAVVATGFVVVASRCRVWLVDGAVRAVRVDARRGVIPRFADVTVPIADVAGVFRAERLRSTPWAHESFACLWVVTRDGQRRVVASQRGAGVETTALRRCAEAIAQAAGVSSEVASGVTFETVGTYGGARCTDAAVTAPNASPSAPRSPAPAGRAIGVILALASLAFCALSPTPVDARPVTAARLRRATDDPNAYLIDGRYLRDAGRIARMRAAGDLPDTIPAGRCRYQLAGDPGVVYYVKDCS